MRNRYDFLTVILMSVSALILFVILGGTIWAFASGRAKPGGSRAGTAGGETSLLQRGVDNPSPAEVLASDSSGQTLVFGDIGVLRAPTADREPVTVVVSPYFPYPSGDIAFREEIVGKTRSIRAAIRAWFAGKTLREITEMGETEVKAALIGEINALFVLGKIDTLYFAEYLALE